MCLLSPINLSPIETSGIGYKIVWKTRFPEVFKPLFPAFDKFGFGSPRSFPNIVHIPKVLYKLGRTYRVKHKKVVETYGGVVYPAGVYLYKDPSYCFSSVANPSSAEYAIIKCKYSKAVAEDSRSVVAMRVTPIAYLLSALRGQEVDWFG